MNATGYSPDQLLYERAREEIKAAAQSNLKKLDLRAVIRFRPPIITKWFADALDQRPYELIAELMNFNVFANINQTIEPQIAIKIAEKHGWRLERDASYDGGFQRTRLKALPPEIGLCGSLETILLDNNDLSALPSEILRCAKLRSLSLSNNTKLRIPPEIAQPRPPYGNAQAILDYYFARQKGAGRPLNEVKLILVGRGGTGKTSIVERLLWKRFTASKAETPGVALCDWAMSETTDTEPSIVAHVWDFAGQTITHSMHQFFLSIRTVYVLVLTGRENSEREDAEYWLRLIAAYGIDPEGSGPPVIIVLNKWDDPGSARARVDRRALKERYPFIVDFVETDCKTNRGIRQLRGLLQMTVRKLSWVQELFPVEYRKVKDRLEHSQQPHLPYDAYRQICLECGVTDQDRQDILAENLHQLGIALNYRQDDRLRFASVLKPQWLTQNVYSLVRLAQRHGGLLKKAAVSAALKSEKRSEMHGFLIDLMVLFELAYPVTEGDRTPTQWLVPQALPDSQPADLEVYRDALNATRLRYRYQTLPVSIVPRFIVRTHPFIEDEMRWASGVVLAFSGARGLVRAHYVDRQVEIVVLGPEAARRELAGLIQREFRFINGQIAGLNPIEETQVASGWIQIKTLEHDEAQSRQTGIATDTGTIDIDPARGLNEFSSPAARDNSWKPRLFISYSHANETQKRTLELHLKILATHGLLHETWHDRKIQAGEDYSKTIKAELNSADVVLLLVSNASLGSKYIQTVEMERALERQAAGETHVVPVILEKCDWKLPELRKLQALPQDAKPIRDWTPQLNGWMSVSDGLRKLFEELRAAHQLTRQEGES